MKLFNMELLPMKAHYFFFNAGTSPIVPFMPTLAKQLGFSSVVVGSLYTVLPIMGMIVKPTMGAIADRFKCQKVVFLGFLALTIAAFFPLMFVPPLPAQVDVELHCAEETNLRLCGADGCVAERLVADGADNATIMCKMSCELNSTFLDAACHSWNWTGLCGDVGKPLLTIVNDHRATLVPPPHTVTFDATLSPRHTLAVQGDCIFTRVSRVRAGTGTEGSAQWLAPYCQRLQVARCRAQCQSDTLADLQTMPDSQILGHYQFWMFTALLVLSWMGMAVVVSVGDAICFSILGEEASKFGHQRLWGSVGFGLSVITAGWLVDRWSLGLGHKDYTPVFYMMAALLTLDLLASSRLQSSEKLQAASILHNVGRMLADVQVVVFLLWLVVVGMCTALIWNFLFWYLEELTADFGCTTTQQWIKTLEGLVNGIQCFGGELPFFFLSGWILKKIGHINTMSLVLFSFSVRFLLYSVLTNPWWCLPVELLSGPTYGLLYATMASYASMVAPPGTDTTVQGLVGAVFEGIGVSSGSFLAGLLFSQMSGAMVFRIMGLAVLVMGVLHVCVQFFLRRRQLLIITQTKDFNRGPGAVYASPSEAIHMLDEPSYELLS